MWCEALLPLIVSMNPPAGQKVVKEQLAAATREFKGEIGVYAKDLLSGEEVALNADAPFPTASTIKTAVMLEAYHRVAEGGLRMTDTLRLEDSAKVGGSGVLNGLSSGLQLTIGDLIYLMIAVSDNTATNLLVGRLGTKAIDDRLAGYGLKQTKIFRPTFRDGHPDVFPELERDYGLGMTTPREMGGLMALIAQGRAVNLQASIDMFGVLRRQQDRTMIPRLLPSDGSIVVGNKTGTDSEKQPDANGTRGSIRADAAIVTGSGVNYVIAIYTRRGADPASGPDNAALLAGARISRLVFDHFTKTRH